MIHAAISLRGHQDELAGESLGEEVALRRNDVGQSVGLRHQRANVTALDVGHEVGEHLLGLEGATDQGQVAQIQRAQVQRADRTGDGTGTDVAAAGAQHAEQV